MAALMGNWLDGELDPVGLFVFVGFSMVSGGLFYLARTVIPRPSDSPEIEASSKPIWELVLFPLLGVVSFVRALFEQGFATAILLILPLMLLGPVALDAIRALRARLTAPEN